jgi:RsiW-degrading membrane proteinase PrsW (M82 family)
MLFIFSGLAALIPMIIYLLIIWRFDRYDREPFKLLLQNYLWGAIGAIALALIGSVIFSSVLNIIIPDSNLVDKLSAIVVAPFVEEITKGVFLFITVSSIKFDNITDGIVYGGAIGLGFGMTENFFYFISSTDNISGWIAIIIIRNLFSGVMHCVSTGTLGAFVALAKFKSGIAKVILPAVGLGIAMFIHAIWNASVSFESTAAIGFLFLFVTVLIFIITFSLSVKNERKIIYSQLLSEASSGLIPTAHLEILSSSRRERKGWIEESIRKTYIKAATTLAFRKIQLENSNGMSKLYYENDISNYRSFIKSLLKNIAAT